MKQALQQCGIPFLITEFSPPTLKAAGRNPELFLRELSSLGFSLHVVEEEEIPRRLSCDDFSVLVNNLRDRGGTNLFCQQLRLASSCSISA